MAESNGLLNRRRGNSTEGSNPSLSAIFFAKKINAEGWDLAGGNTTPAEDDNGIPETPKGFEERSERRHKVTQ